tara:strand:+ start:17 stop:271 length:255 start_codon:yes stop_codon:yes gene_type:complete
MLGVLGKEKNKKIIKYYFDLTLYEFESGLSIQDIENLKKEYIEKELYLQCEGIQQGLEYIRFLILLKLIINNNDYENENNTKAS